MMCWGGASGPTGAPYQGGSASRLPRSSPAWPHPISSSKAPPSICLSARARATSGYASGQRGFSGRVAGVTVVLKERVKKHPPVCQSCHRPVGTCCHCGVPLSLTEEKGVDVAIATDMIKLVWEDAYDWAVLVSSDRDFIPAVEFLNAKGRKVLHAGFPPRGSDLAARCWGSLDLRPHLPGLERT